MIGNGPKTIIIMNRVPPLTVRGEGDGLVVLLLLPLRNHFLSAAGRTKLV